MKRGREDIPMDQSKRRGVHGGAGVGPVADPPFRQLKVEDALAYLDKVKTQFGHQPHIYNQFLEIMKNFKAQTIDTPGVIKAVSNLFRGHNNLILGFNTFLPPGYQIDIEQIMRGDPGGMAARAAAAAAQALPPPLPAPPTRPPLPPPTPPSSSSIQPGPSRPATRGDHGQPLEFDHAINYVTKIKKRFVDDTDTYKTFLEILHAYQQQQRSIKDVLDHVSTLFRDHPDLLEDFTYFLPDAVQSQAKERLARAAARVRGSKARLQSKRDQEDRARTARGTHKRQQAERQQGAGGYPLTAGARLPRSRPLLKQRRHRDSEIRMQLPSTEKRFFRHVKQALGPSGWAEFLKCLDLCSRDIVSRVELLSLVNSLFLPSHDDLLEDLKRLLNSRGNLDLSAEDLWYSMPVSEIDFSSCRQCTPSYRALPDDFPPQVCSERDPVEQTVMNDTWVSVPTGSEDYSFKNMRKNIYEEALFRCEDERYEIDMVIDNNASAIRVVAPLVEELEALSSAKGFDWQFRLDRRSLGVIHLKAIARVYGDHGNEALELLRKNPAGALPIILARLKQKDEEWKRARTALNKQWKEVLEKNYYKSLDHRSFYFKQADKKAVSAKHLIAQMRARIDATDVAAANQLADQQDAEAGKLARNGDMAGAEALRAEADAIRTKASKSGSRGGAASNAAAAAAEAHSVGMDPLDPSFKFKYADLSVLNDVLAVLSYAVERDSSLSKEAVADLWQSFVGSFFCFSLDSKGAPRDDAHPVVGTRVSTPYGTGVFAGVRPASDDGLVPEALEVLLQWGTLYLQPRDVHVVEEGTVVGAADAAAAAASEAGFGRVRPVTASGESVPPQAADESYPAFVPTDRKQRFCCSNATYVFLRLHHLMAERLAQARQLCARGGGRRTLAVHPVDRAVAEHKGEEMEGVAGPDDEPAAPAGSSEELYQNYLTALYALVGGTMDSTKYEDECRALMGTGSYLLFTMDRLITSMVKSLKEIVSDATAIKMRKLYTYQNYRQKLATGASGSDSEKAANAATVSRSYVANAASLLSTETAYLCQYIVGASDSEATLTITYMRNTNIETARATIQPPSSAIPVYVSHLVGQSRADHGTGAAQPPMLTRHLPASAGAADGAPSPGVIQSRNMTTRVSADSMRLVPTAGTDVIVRPNRGAAATGAAATGTTAGATASSMEWSGANGSS